MHSNQAIMFRLEVKSIKRVAKRFGKKEASS